MMNSYMQFLRHFFTQSQGEIPYLVTIIVMIIVGVVPTMILSVYKKNLGLREKAPDLKEIFIHKGIPKFHQSEWRLLSFTPTSFCDEESYEVRVIQSSKEWLLLKREEYRFIQIAFQSDHHKMLALCDIRRNKKKTKVMSRDDLRLDESTKPMLCLIFKADEVPSECYLFVEYKGNFYKRIQYIRRKKPVVHWKLKKT